MMKLTKYEHACFTLEKDGKLLVVDPGVFTTDLPALENVVAVVITHVHPDHFDTNALEALFALNPDMVVYSPKQVDDEIKSSYSHTIVKSGQTITNEPFRFEFFGGEHVRVHDPLTPQFANVGVMINGSLYYPGDSFDLPDEKDIPVLALPTSGPWLKVGGVMDFVLAAKAKRAFYTHDALWSEKSQSFEKNYIGLAAKEIGTEIIDLAEPVEIDG
jgi:L-ascorbate metabolism protein UlaG (beta-lactamase superfamily)